MTDDQIARLTAIEFTNCSGNMWPLSFKEVSNPNPSTATATIATAAATTIQTSTSISMATSKPGLTWILLAMDWFKIRLVYKLLSRAIVDINLKV